MVEERKESLRRVFPVSWSYLADPVREEFAQWCPGPESFLARLSGETDGVIPPFLADLAGIEFAINQASEDSLSFSPISDSLTHNPTLQLLQVEWQKLPALLGAGSLPPEPPLPGAGFVLVWRHPESGEVFAETASDEELLILKMAAEGITPGSLARQADIPEEAIEEAIGRALAKGICSAPGYLLRRDPAVFQANDFADRRYLTTRFFTLQWHITQTCDLHCRHCYDRSRRKSMDYRDALRILDDLSDFSRKRQIQGQVSFTGGNPLLHPRFFELYREAVDRGLMVAILGNPAPREALEKLAAIGKPAFYQVSLEGLEEHTDYIRGKGHFGRTVVFLELLRELEIFSMVMLTLTRDNLGQVLELGEFLRDRVDSFTFNRLSAVGEGAALALPPVGKFQAFLADYLRAASDNPAMRLKDNLFNVIRCERGGSSFGGCAGFGCGAAFNFVSILPDGEVHACRKFPSPIGNILRDGLAALYDSPLAARYRNGAAECRGCKIRPVCGGCLAVAHSHGLNIFEQRDPFCFRDPRG
jgi:selenobiotic family peptide radical SAM maturase